MTLFPSDVHGDFDIDDWINFVKSQLKIRPLRKLFTFHKIYDKEFPFGIFSPASAFTGEDFGHGPFGHPFTADDDTTNLNYQNEIEPHYGKSITHMHLNNNR